MATDSGFKRNYNVLLWANVISALVAFASITITARVLTVKEFGLLVLIQAYTAIVAQVAGFRTWEPLIKFGANALQQKDNQSLAAIVHLSFWVDMFTAVMGWILALVGAYFLSDLMGWNESTFHLVAIYSFTILLNVSGFAVGVLRLNDQYRKLAFQQIAFQVVRFILITICFLMSLNLTLVLLSWVVSEIFAYLLLLMMGVFELKERGVKIFGGVKFFKERRSYLSFLVANNISTSIRMISREIDVIVVGLFVGKAGAGIYKLAVQMASVFSKLTDPLHVLLLPIFARLQAAGNTPEIRRMVIKITIVVFVAFIVAYALAFTFGELVINILFGSEYHDVYDVLLIYLVAIGLSGLLLTVVPVMQAYGKAVLCLRVQAKATIGYLVALVPLCYFWGLEGAALSYIVFYLLWALFMRTAFFNALR